MTLESKLTNTPAWTAFAWISFALSVLLMAIGVYLLPVDMWIKGYFFMGLFFTIASCFILAKTVRDNHEAERFINRVNTARTEKLLSEYETA